MKHTSGLKSLDLTNIITSKNKISSEKKVKTFRDNNQNSKSHYTFLEESLIHNSSEKSIFARNRENSIQTYKKYLKLLDPSFLNDAEHENLRSISIVDNSDLKLNNCHVPQKIMRLLPLERSEIKTHKSFHHNSSLKLSEIRKINNDNTSSMMSENKNVLEENSNITSILKNPLKNQELHTMFLIIFFLN